MKSYGRDKSSKDTNQEDTNNFFGWEMYQYSLLVYLNG